MRLPMVRKQYVLHCVSLRCDFPFVLQAPSPSHLPKRTPRSKRPVFVKSESVVATRLSTTPTTSRKPISIQRFRDWAERKSCPAGTPECQRFRESSPARHHPSRSCGSTPSHRHSPLWLSIRTNKRIEKGSNVRNCISGNLLGCLPSLLQ